MIFIDNQENRSGITSILDMMDVIYEMCPLKICDYHVTGEHGLVVMEHKNIIDYINSLLTGHLQDQIIRMNREFAHSFIIVEGSLSVGLAETGASRKAILSSLVGASIKTVDEGAKGSTSIIPSEDIWDTATILERTQLKLSDPSGLIRTPYIGAPRVIGGNNQLRALCAIPNIGEVIGKALLTKFDTLYALSRATESELKTVKNVGNVLANAIRSFFREEYVES